MSVPLREVLAALDARYDPALAESWDAVGLVCGDPDVAVRRVLFAVDPTAAVVDDVLAAGAELLITHHPLFLTPVHGVPADDPKGRLVHRLIRGGAALFVAHTNADRAPDSGVNDALAAIAANSRRVIGRSSSPTRPSPARGSPSAGSRGTASRTPRTAASASFTPESGARSALVCATNSAAWPRIRRCTSRPFGSSAGTPWTGVSSSG